MRAILPCVVLLPLLILDGCAVRQTQPAAYRLLRQDKAEILVPPGVASPDLTQRSFKTSLTAKVKPCNREAAGLTLHAAGRSATVIVNRDALLRQPAGWLTGWTAELEADGCIPAADGPVLAARIADALPLPTGESFRLLHSDDRQTGRVEIGPFTRIQVVSPLLRDGVPPDAPVLGPSTTASNANGLEVTLKASDDLIGYETAWFALRPRASGPGTEISFLSAERHIQGVATAVSRASVNYFHFTADAGFYRMFYKAGQTEFTALVIAARTRADLEKESKTLEAGGASCDKLSAEYCISIPKRSAVNAFITVAVNGTGTTLSWGSRVADAIRAAGERNPNSLLPHLSVRSLSAGALVPVTFDPGDTGILNLPLSGGESIAWK